MTVVKFQMNVVVSASFDRAEFIQVLAAELNCPPQQIFIDWVAAGLSAVALRTQARSSSLHRPAAIALQNSVTLQAEFRWSQSRDAAVAPAALVSLLESKLSDPNSPIRTQLGITGISRQSPPAPAATASARLSDGGIAGIVIAVLVVVGAGLAYFYRQKLRELCNTRVGRGAAASSLPTHLNDVSIVSNASIADISFTQSPVQVPFISSGEPPLHPVASPAAPANFASSSPPPKKPLPAAPAALVEDPNRYSVEEPNRNFVLNAGAQGAEMSRDLELSSMQVLRADVARMLYRFLR